MSARAAAEGLGGAKRSCRTGARWGRRRLISWLRVSLAVWRCVAKGGLCAALAGVHREADNQSRRSQARAEGGLRVGRAFIGS